MRRLQPAEDHGRSSAPILHRGLADGDLDRDPLDVDDKSALAPLGLLARAPTRRAAALRRFRRLGVDRGRGLGASRHVAPEGAKRVHYPVADPVAAPRMEMVLNRRRRWKTTVKRAPLASVVEHALDRVGPLPKVGLAGLPLFPRGGRRGPTRTHSSSLKSLPNRARGRANRVLAVSFQSMSRHPCQVAR